MEESRRIFDALPDFSSPDLCSHIACAWLELLSTRDPWHRMPLDDRTGSGRQIIAAVIVGYEVDETERRRSLLAAACKHGEFRRRQRCALHTLTEEIGLIRNAVLTLMRQGGASRGAVAAAANALRSDMRAIERSSYSGFLDWDAIR